MKLRHEPVWALLVHLLATTCLLAQSPPPQDPGPGAPTDVPVVAVPAAGAASGPVATLPNQLVQQYLTTLLALIGQGAEIVITVDQARGDGGKGEATAGGGKGGKKGPVKTNPIPGFDLIGFKDCGHLRTAPGLAKAMEALQSADPHAGLAQARTVLQKTLTQIDQVVASPPTGLSKKKLREGNQCEATREALKVAQQPNCDPTALRNMVASAQNKSSPILLDMNGDGVANVTTPGVSHATGAFVEAGSVRFDVSGSGQGRRTEWLVPRQDGLLALDVNGNGVVDSAVELFGDIDGYEHGYDKLAVLDRNGDRRLTGSELAYLSVWVDDGDGVCQPGESQLALSLGITQIDLIHRDYVSSFVRNGQTLRTWDWFPRTKE